MHPDNLGGQFSYFRGLRLGTEPAATSTDWNDDKAVLRRLRPSEGWHWRDAGERRDFFHNVNRPNWPLMGGNWTDHEHTAHRFALDQNAAKDRGSQVPWDSNWGQTIYGGVLQAKSSLPPSREAHRGYEQHVRFPPRRLVHNLTLHLHRRAPGMDYRDPTHLRSIEIPPSRWEHF